MMHFTMGVLIDRGDLEGMHNGLGGGLFYGYGMEFICFSEIHTGVHYRQRRALSNQCDHELTNHF